MRKFVFQNICQTLLNNLTHDQNFIKTMLIKGSGWQNSVKKCHFPLFPIQETHIKAIQKHG